MMKSEKKRVQKIFSVCLSVFLIVIIAFSVCIFFISVHARRNNVLPTFFGYSFSIVVSDSMVPELQVGTMIFIKTVGIAEVDTGDNVVFISRGETSSGKRVVHKVREKGVDEFGEYLITQGVNNPAIDDYRVRGTDIIGKQTGSSLAMGRIVTFFGRGERVLFFAIGLIAVAFSVKQIKRIIVLNREKKNGE